MISLTDIVIVAPRILRENYRGWRWWCLICKKDLGSATPRHPEIRRDARLHAEQHIRKMREQL